MISIRSWAVVAALVVAPLVAAQSATTYSGSVRVRGEGWSWFDTPGYDDQYAFLGVIARGSVAHRFSPTTDAQLELAVPILSGLPDNAIAPAPRGQLGFGATYFAANDREENAANVIVKQAFVRFGTPKLNARLGRFEFIEGMEVIPKDPVLAAVKRTRVAHRLIGNFGFTHVGRSADGIQVVANPTATINLTGVVARPTAGAFTVEANESLDDVGYAYAAATRSNAASDMRLFLIAYEDDRGVRKTENRPAMTPFDSGAIEVTTLGGNYQRAMKAAGGTVDVLLWGALQRGDWGSLDHEANAFDAEVGFSRGAGSIRGGLFRSSGDDAPDDGTHGTFFQMLPTARLYARFPLYNAMNSTDAFVGATLKHGKWSFSSELHRVTLTESRDLWYAGGGAFEETTFGFAGRPSNGNDDLVTVLDLNADYALNAKTTLTGYAAYAKGGDVVDAIFNGTTGAFVYAEVTRRF